jgi:POT family proton-dependent oligopeptide transporter
MTSGPSTTRNEVAPPTFIQTMGHPSPLWMLFMSEFWERFAFYGIRWALVLYIVTRSTAAPPDRRRRTSPRIVLA